MNMIIFGYESTLSHMVSHFLPFQIDTTIFIYFLYFFTKWSPSAILDVRKSLSIAFLAISGRYGTFCFEMFNKMATVGHFGCPKITSDRISGHFRLIGHFGCPKFTFDRISGHFRSIRNSFFFGGHFGCPKITFDRISGHFRSIGHFGCPKFTFDRISGHIRSIRNFLYFFKKFYKMAAGGHFRCQKITFDFISGHFRSIWNSSF